MPKFNNIYCTLCAIIYVQLLSYCHGEVMRNITGLNAAVDHLEETLKILTEKVNAGTLKCTTDDCNYYMTIILYVNQF